MGVSFYIGNTTLGSVHMVEESAHTHGGGKCTHTWWRKVNTHMVEESEHTHGGGE